MIPRIYNGESGVSVDPIQDEASNLIPVVAWLQRYGDEFKSDQFKDLKKIKQAIDLCADYRRIYGALKRRLDNEGKQPDEAAPNFRPWPYVRSQGEVIRIVQSAFGLWDAVWEVPSETAIDLEWLDQKAASISAYLMEKYVVELTTEPSHGPVAVVDAETNLPLLDGWGRIVTVDAPLRNTKDQETSDVVGTISDNFEVGTSTTVLGPRIG